jgi:hypothetical protein
MVERVKYLISFYQLPKMTRWLKLRVKQQKQSEDTCYNEVNMGRWVCVFPVPKTFCSMQGKNFPMYTPCSRPPPHLHTCTLTSLPRVQLKARLWSGMQLECHRHACGLSSVVRHHPRVSAVHRLSLRLTAKRKTLGRQDVSNKTGLLSRATFTRQCIFVFLLRVGWNSHVESFPAAKWKTFLEHDPHPLTI